MTTHSVSDFLGTYTGACVFWLPAAQLPSAARATYVAMPPFYYQNLQPDEEGQLQDGTHMSWCDDRSSAGSVSPFFFQMGAQPHNHPFFKRFLAILKFFCRDLYIDLVFRLQDHC